MNAGPALLGALKALGFGVVIVLALVVILAALRTELPRSPGVMSDALGPDPGETVTAYLERAADSLTDDHGAESGGETADAGAPRWALVTAEAPLSVGEADDVVADLARVSGLSVQVPVPGVAMPVVDVTLAEPVAGESSREAVFARAIEQAAGRVQPGDAPVEAAGGAVDGERRAAATAALTASRLRSGQAAIIGLVVRGTSEQLRAVASTPGVRAVEALPGDAVRGRFAVRPLQPQQVEVVDPLPDHAPVPPA